MKNPNSFQSAALIIVLCILAVSCKQSKNVHIEGEMKVWHTITLTFEGPETAEYDTINPFTDYRLDIEFTSDNQKINVPGYYAADGTAAQTSARSGNKWRVHFCPPSEGNWNYSVSFLNGKNIAITDDPGEGE